MSKRATYLGQDADSWAQKLTDRDPVLRRLAIYALGEIGPQAKAVASALDAGLQDPIDWVRVWTAASLAKMTGDRRALTSLVAEIRSPEAFVRSLAAWHLGRLGANFPGIEAGIEALQRLRDDDDPSVRAEAEIALRTLQSKGSLPSGTAFLSSSL